MCTTAWLLHVPPIFDAVVDQGDEPSGHQHTKKLVYVNRGKKGRGGMKRMTYSATSVTASTMEWSLIHMWQGGTQPPAHSSASIWFGLLVSGVM